VREVAALATDSPAAALGEAVGAAADAILRWQRDDGSWRGRNRGGPMFAAATLALEHALGTLTSELAERGRVALCAAQLADGGLAPWPGADGSNAEATLYLCAGLRAVGVPARDAALLRARERLRELGGARAAGPLALTIGALAGEVDVRELPRVPAELALVPGHDTAVARLLGVNALLPMRILPFLWEALRRGPERRASTLAASRLEAYLRRRQSAAGGIAGVPIFTLLGLVALRLAGVDRDDEAMRRGLAYARRVVHASEAGLEIEPFESSYWDTAHMVRVLARLPHARHRAAARRGAEWLLRGQSCEASPRDWQTPPPGAPEAGGWSWQPGNEWNPDFDTTAEVLSALGEVARMSAADRDRVASAVERAVAWLLAFQNADGGWAAFSHGKPRPPRGALYLRGRGPIHHVRSWLAENGDPSTADIVGRVLYGLGSAGAVAAPHPCVRAAAAFLAHHQIPETGAWWGRWAVNYLAGTAYVVSGLTRVGIAPDTRALRWMLGCQNDDGGWGESTESYADPREAGSGPSTVALTGLVTWALQRAPRDVTVERAVRRGIAFLLDRQLSDGSFDDARCFSTMFPLRAYWLNDTYPTFFALEALAERHG
jgi:squalene-hopene/tetraprenyl-beta-curcumene cyclase